jgi:hypothetical protein
MAEAATTTAMIACGGGVEKRERGSGDGSKCTGGRLGGPGGSIMRRWRRQSRLGWLGLGGEGE